jgi:hypothetical protein
VLGPVARSRVLLGVLLTAAASSLLLAGGTSSAVSPVAATPFYGPVAATPPISPLVPIDGPLLGPAAARWLAPPAPAAAAVGPQVPAGQPVEAAETVGPGSPAHLVRVVQRQLNAKGAQLRVDGAWGPATTRAVQRLQAQAGLPVDGRLGPRTARVLQG